jgi:Leucine-rich repeat (LRR) protein
MNITTTSFRVRLALPLSILLIFAQLSFTQTNTCRVQDSLQLVSLYNATGGANWTIKWNLSQPINTWHGVILNVDGCVQKIFLGKNNLVGTLFNINIPTLEILELRANILTGSIPNFNLPNLKELYLYTNPLSGTIPNFNLPNLEILDIGYGQLNGTIPNISLPKLRQFFLNNNAFSGSLPNLNLPSATVISLNNNQLSGCIPESYKAYCNKTVFIYGNPKLTLQSITNSCVSNLNTGFCNDPACVNDVIPPVISNCPQNVSLLTTNTSARATWTSPSATDNCTGNPTLTSNYASGDSFRIGTTTVIYSASDVRNNNTTCSFNVRVAQINNSCRQSDSLQLVSFYNAVGGANWWLRWDLFAPIDTWYGVILNAEGCVQRISITGNNLSGNISNLNLPNLQYLSLNSNKLNGTIPIFNLPNIQFFDLSYNSFTGTIPNFNFPNLEELYLNTNKLSGSIPEFNLPKLSILGLQENELSGTIPNFNFPNLKGFSLRGNQLSGCIPASFKSFCEILGRSDIRDNPNLATQDFDAFCINNTGACPPPVTTNCTSKSNSPWSEWIANVKLANLNNTTSKTREDRYTTGYSDWTDKTATVSRGQAYPLSILPDLSWSGSQSNLYFRAWIDYNKNSIFEDTELVLEQNSIRSGVFQNVTIPTIATLGTTIMRVSMKKDAYPTACETFAAGEVEDYSVVIQGAVDPCATDVTPPVLSICPQNIILTTTGTTAVTNWGPPSATDNCAVLSLTSNYNIGNYISGFTFPIGLTTVIYTAVDTKGNTAACSFTVNVSAVTNPCENDVTPPVLSICPQNISLTTTGTTAVAVWAEPAATDNCGTPSVSKNFEIGQSFPIGLTTVIYTATDAKNNKSTCSFNVTVTKITPPTRICSSTGTAPWELWTSKVEINTINNASGKFKDYSTLGYSDYTNLLTTVTHGQAYPLSITPSLSWVGNLPNAYCRVWIDFNKNNIFDLEELVLEQANQSPIKQNIYIPTTAATGNVRMRIAVKLGGYPTACEVFGKGEVEDYLLTLQRGVAPPSNCRYNDSLVLVDVYNSMGGANWVNKWDLTKPMITWLGIGTDTNGCVIALISNQLEGNLAPSIGNLSQLRYMRLGGSGKITGTIPSSFANLSNLIELQIEDNQLTGNIPDFVGNLPNLYQILLYNNKLSGPLPSTFGNLKKVQFLILNNNQLSGDIPSSMSNMSELSTLELSNNSFTGSIPNVFGNIPSFRYLSLKNNKFSDTLPKNLAQLKNVLTLDFSNNLLSGCIPTDFKVLCGKDVFLSGNINLPNGGDWAAFCTNNLGICNTPFAADIALTIASTPTTYQQWKTNTIRVTAKNNGTTAISNIKIELKRPNKMAFGGTKVASTGLFTDYCAGGVECSEWVIPSLAAGATATLDAPFFVLDAIAPIVATTRLLSSTPTDANTVNNTASVTITPAAPAIQSLSRQKPTQYLPIIVQSIAPNPTEGDVVIEVESLKEQVVQFEFSNTMGQIIRSEKRPLEKGTNQVKFDVYEFSDGVYLLQTDVNRGRISPTKFVKF